MAMPTTKAECDKTGFQLEPGHEDLHDAQDHAVKMTLSRGVGCDGGAKVVGDHGRNSRSMCKRP